MWPAHAWHSYRLHAIPQAKLHLTDDGHLILILHVTKLPDTGTFIRIHLAALTRHVDCLDLTFLKDGMPLTTKQPLLGQEPCATRPDVVWLLVSWPTIWNVVSKTKEAGLKYYNSSV